jgi:hypothetical protein
VKPEVLRGPFVEGGEALTVGEARDSYCKIERSNYHSDNPKEQAKCKKGLKKYWRILEGGRRLRERYGDRLTMGMVTRRLSPLDDSGEWLTPWECNEMLHGGAIHRSMRDAWRYQLKNYNYKWVRVTAGTRTAGTPHEHILFWVEDGDDEITVDHFSTTLDKHLDHCQNAYEKHHTYRQDGTDGAITVQHSPSLLDTDPEKMAHLLVHTDAPPRRNTAGAQYLASQLSHVQMLDYFDSKKADPVDPLIDGAAIAWSSSHNWFRACDGFPA